MFPSYSFDFREYPGSFNKSAEVGEKYLSMIYFLLCFHSDKGDEWPLASSFLLPPACARYNKSDEVLLEGNS